jgi:hypothetical protein
VTLNRVRGTGAPVLKIPLNASAQQQTRGLLTSPAVSEQSSRATQTRHSSSLLTQKQHHQRADQPNTLMLSPKPLGWIRMLWWTNMMPKAARNIMESTIRKTTTSCCMTQPAARIQRHARRRRELSSGGFRSM